MRQISRSEVTSLCDAEIDRVPVTDFGIACARKKIGRVGSLHVFTAIVKREIAS